MDGKRTHAVRLRRSERIRNGYYRRHEWLRRGDGAQVTAFLAGESYAEHLVMTAAVLLMPAGIVACKAVMAVMVMLMDAAMLVMMMKGRRHAYVTRT